jgi:hypothetical protein
MVFLGDLTAQKTIWYFNRFESLTRLCRRIEYRQDHPTPFSGQYVVGTASRSGVHGFHPNALTHQALK